MEPKDNNQWREMTKQLIIRSAECILDNKFPAVATICRPFWHTLSPDSCPGAAGAVLTEISVQSMAQLHLAFSLCILTASYASGLKARKPDG